MWDYRGGTRRGLSDNKNYSPRREVFPMIRGTPDDKRYSQCQKVFPVIRGSSDDKKLSHDALPAEMATSTF